MIINKKFSLPTSELLADHKCDFVATTDNKELLTKILADYGISISKIESVTGPTVTVYNVVLTPGTRVSKIKNLEEDIMLSLAVSGTRIAVSDHGTVTIEVPNQDRAMVSMKNIVESEEFKNNTFELPVAFGKTNDGKVHIADLSVMPHLLMAGATGQGKSVGINVLITSLLYKKTPEQLKFVLIDPKKVELGVYNMMDPYLVKFPGSDSAIITDPEQAIDALNSLCAEMDQRYMLLQKARVRNIKEYNFNREETLPYIVVVVDEFADLAMTVGKDVEYPINRLAQLARAVGIHLVIATQRPSVDIITGTIKANFPARVAFKTSSSIDSRTILGESGAEQLTGKGDMLLNNGFMPVRIQCAYIDTSEVINIMEHIAEQQTNSSNAVLEPNKEIEKDILYEQAKYLVVEFQQGSASFLQRKLKIGYIQASEIIDQLEEDKVVGPFDGTKPREVLACAHY